MRQGHFVDAQLQWLQMLLALYFFLAGIAVSQRQLLLLTPAATALFAGLMWLATLLSHCLLPMHQ